VIIPFSALRDVITIEDAAGDGALGPTFSSPRNVSASIQDIERLVLDEMGQQTTIDIMTIIRPEAGPVKPGSKVSLPNGDTYRVVKAFPMPDYRRPSHFELMLRSWGVVE
jgi:hypothetical protein